MARRRIAAQPESTAKAGVGSPIPLLQPPAAAAKGCRVPLANPEPLPMPQASEIVSAVPSPCQLEPAVTEVPVPLAAWKLAGEAVIGLAHRRIGLPCQDAVAWRNTTRPILALSDGAGSAAISERGAAALVGGVSRLLISMEDALSLWLDDFVNDAETQAALWSRRLLAHASGLLDDLARAERRNVRDLRATLLLAIVGSARVFWWQVGDGAVVARTSSGVQALGQASKTKGEFANQTMFVDAASFDDVQFGLLAAADVSGLALMSDGGAERLVAHDGSRVASRVSGWFDDVVEQRLTPDRIALAFHEAPMWERTSLDDRSIVLAARSVPNECRMVVPSPVNRPEPTPTAGCEETIPAARHSEVVNDKPFGSLAQPTAGRERRIFVSRHPGAIAWARRHPWGMLAEFVTHLEVSDVSADDVVIGTLPIHLVAEICARGAHYLHLAISLKNTQRGSELSADELDAAGAHLVAYRAFPVPIGR
ncbi:CRISPR-associated protein Csx16 [Azonexus sp.]|uniref:CRISPR-associated protein Csx16 n=1 Tax=Azonexus sp. TaxID=1872668 RepID=UPI0035B0D97F